MACSLSLCFVLFRFIFFGWHSKIAVMFQRVCLVGVVEATVILIPMRMAMDPTLFSEKWQIQKLVSSEADITSFSGRCRHTVWGAD